MTDGERKALDIFANCLIVLGYGLGLYFNLSWFGDMATVFMIRVKSENFELYDIVWFILRWFVFVISVVVCAIPGILLKIVASNMLRK